MFIFISITLSDGSKINKDEIKRVAKILVAEAPEQGNLGVLVEIGVIKLEKSE